MQVPEGVAAGDRFDVQLPHNLPADARDDDTAAVANGKHGENGANAKAIDRPVVIVQLQ
eukprot:SAG25_NODE_2241_length_1805_cov_1.587339_1_plen_59_part_00